MLSLHFPKEQWGSAFLEKTDTQLAHSSYTRLIGAGLTKSSCPCCPWEQTAPTNISPFCLRGAIIKSKNFRSVRSVLGPRPVQLQPLTYTKCRFSPDAAVLQGLNSSKTISHSLLINPNIAEALMKHLSQSQTQGLSCPFHCKANIRLFFALQSTHTCICIFPTRGRFRVSNSP